MRMQTRLASFSLAACALVICAAVALAQSPTTGEIAGQVTDPQGAAVANASISLTAPSAQIRESKTDGSGRYRFPLLDPGTYSLTVQAQGFASAKRTDAHVRITETTALDVQLTVAGGTQSVSVVAEPIVVQDNDTEGRVIDDTQVNQLPLPTRNYTQLLALSPGAVSSLPNNAELGRGDADINVNGQRSTSNNVVIDGTEANSPGTNSTPSLTVPPPDAIQEFIVQTSMYDASQGRNSGGNVNVVTKSGTNRLHGNVWEYFRNDALNANDFFLNEAGEPRPELKRNQFGGTIGGPIVKDKTFFFFAYQGTRERNGASPTYSLGTTLIPQDLTNDRSTTTLTNMALNDYGVALDPSSLHILQATLPNGRFAIPSASSPLAGSTALSITPISGVSSFTEDYFNIGIDQQISQKNKLSGKFIFSNDPQYQAIYGFLGPNPNEVPGYGGSPDFHNRILSLADSHIFSPNLINEARFGFSRIHEISLPQEPFTNAQFGITNPLAASFPGMATMEVPGLFTIGSSPLADNKSVTQTWQAQDMVSYTMGRHFIRFGAQFRRYDIDFYFHAFSRGEIVFNDFQDFLAGGSPSSVDASLLGAGVPDRGFRASDGAAFVQDDIHLTSNLTVNAGLRLDHFGGYSEIRGRFSSFDAATFAENTMPCTLATPCTQGITLGSSGQQLNPSKYAVAPRIGFAWSPRKENDLSIRGGFGMFYDRFSDRFANLQVFNYPYDSILTGLFTAGFLGTPFPDPTGFTFPLPAQAPSPIPLLIDNYFYAEQNPINGFFAAPNMKIPYTLVYNLDAQYSFAKSWLADIGYLGNHGNHLINLYNFNQGAFGNPDAPYTIDGFSNNKALFGFDQVQTEAESRYNALQTSLTKRFAHGLQFLASYTWSHSIDNNSGDNIVNAESELNPLPGDQQNLASQFGTSDFDRKHRFVFSGVYDLPKFYAGNSSFAKSAFNNWETSGMVVLQTGLPFTVYCSNGTDLNNRADLSGQPVITSSGSTVSRLDDYFNAAAFNYCFDTTATNAPPFGTSARNFLRGPGQKNVDFSVIKFFPVTEGSKVEFRAEFFNLFNFVNFAQPYSNTVSTLNNLGMPVFVGPVGAITQTVASPRIIQFALKYNF
ncbi:MAG: carboxypeptidase regulatory-like domain-containing protein [Terriglobales bacterium]